MYSACSFAGRTPRIKLTLARAILLFVGVGYGCDSPVSPEAQDTLPDVRPYVTPAVLADVDEQGHFRLKTACGSGCISEKFAEEIAVAAVREFIIGGVGIAGYPTWRTGLEETFGGPIDWDAAELAERPSYLAQPYVEPLPDTIPPSVRNTFGPHYLIPIMVHGRQVAVISVAAYTTIRLDSLGHLRNASGNDFRPTGISRDSPFGLPASPELAVQEAVRQFGSRVAEVPELLQPHYTIATSYSQWRLVFEKPVRVRRLIDRIAMTTSVLYAGQFPSMIDARPTTGKRLRFFVAADQQPSAELIRIISDASLHEFLWPLRHGFPVRFYEVEPYPH